MAAEKTREAGDDHRPRIREAVAPLQAKIERLYVLAPTNVRGLEALVDHMLRVALATH